ncbi:tyrosine-type recombinase/integrase [Quisquiliibacterium transsilvanicum]|uniref:Integrase n=1 Tax=Quisquiliibacterium transsilvanicum TaxID=1549638 RepID=A0A7W8M822_9BURK|nr:tyrosine-type recombinase/integrase [Quisquiliibacterium transsilvanicum]MBB5271378.1 integrase [Quisquiliibacterium transsilvanicum]
MSLYFDEARGRWRWQFKATLDGQRHRSSRLLPRGWSEAQARRYDEQETARTYARLSTGKRVSSVPLIDVAVDLYLRERVPQLRDGLNAARNLAHLFPDYQGRGMDEIGKVARAYAKAHAGELKPATIRQRLATLRAAASYALKYHSIGSKDWIAAMPMPSVNNARHHYLRRAEVLMLARAISDPPTRAWVLLTFATGSRPGELFRAEPVDGGAAFLMPETKNGDRELKPVLPRFRRYARHWPMPHDYTWHSRLFREARQAVGLDHIRPHDLRHSTASALTDAGATLKQVGEVLGHRTAQATNRYAHLYTERKSALLESIFEQKPKRRA